jgi:hypothetical protein
MAHVLRHGPLDWQANRQRTRSRGHHSALGTQQVSNETSLATDKEVSRQGLPASQLYLEQFQEALTGDDTQTMSQSNSLSRHSLPAPIWLIPSAQNL